MKIKKLAALALSCAMVVAGGAMFAACGDEKDPDKDTGFVEDTRIWYAVGADSKGTLKDQGWDQNNSKYAFVKDTTVTNENVFTISLDIYAGTKEPGRSFKFLYKETADEKNVPWTRQVGINHLVGTEGEGPDAVFKMNGVTVFTTSDGQDANNMYLAKGQEGRYKFTLKTKSNTDMNPIITVEKESSITVDYDMYVIGDINKFGVTKVEMVENIVEGKATTWTGQFKVTANDLYRDANGAIVADEESGEAAGQYAAVCILNDRDGKTFVPVAGEGVIIKEVKTFNNKDYTCLLVPEGTYNVVFTEAKTDTEVGGSVTVTENAFEMYLIGSFCGWAANEGYKDYPMTEQADGSWTATITVTKDETLKTYNVKGLTDSDKYSAGADVTITAGTWAVKYDPETNTFKAEKLGYHIVGAYGEMTNDTGWEVGLKAGKAVALEDKGEGVYSAEVEFAADNQFKVVCGTSACGVYNNLWYGAPATDPLYVAGGNFKITEAGTYIVTATVSGESVTITVVKKA